MSFSTFLQQRRNVLGVNGLDLLYADPTNTQSISFLPNDKLATKQILKDADIPVPETYAIIQTHREASAIDWETLPESFVLKPNLGLMGGGILVVFGRSRNRQWVRGSGNVTEKQLHAHVNDILDGNFSHGNVPDTAFVEQRIQLTKELKSYAVGGGIPDIRVYMANYIPVMAMLRLPSPESKGLANIHAGGIGLGVDLATGITTSAVHHGQRVTRYPGTRQLLTGIVIPNFQNALLLACKAGHAMQMGWTGVDIALDREHGQLVLEVNGYPGLDIQLANLATLRDRIRRVEELPPCNPEHAVEIATSLFSRPSRPKTTRRTIGALETVVVFEANGTPHQHRARIDTGIYRSVIDDTLVGTYGLTHNENNQRVPITIELGGKKIQTEMNTATREKSLPELLIGRRDVKEFLIDPSKER